jgi:hypothetical protein
MNQEATGKTYLECIRMLNGLEKSLERHAPGGNAVRPSLRQPTNCLPVGLYP